MRPAEAVAAEASCFARVSLVTVGSRPTVRPSALALPTRNDRSVGTSSDIVISPALTSIGCEVSSFASSTSFCASSTEYFGCTVWLATSTFMSFFE